ncbi:sugar ABC transporter ATP-binding protein [Pendulispora albinea]|uniref:Sugar ABC transporter ATP-binding protein n=1 Tax=Pendulispora albinea TaxID=2741071 RepID=A0ABZ2M906_9BACT
MNDAATTALTLEGVSKGFSGVQALSGVTLACRAGEVLALMGENGAGKSTLLKVLSGDHQPDAGRILVEGTPRVFRTPAEAHRAGVRVIYQEPEIIPHVSVAENVYVGALPHRFHWFDRRGLLRRFHEDLERFGFSGMLDPELRGNQLSAAHRQLVEILRALVGDVRILAFDEPTSSLAEGETDVLFALIERLRASGVAIIYVSHRMQEIFRIADRVAVLRDGRYVGDRPVRAGRGEPAELTEDEVVRMMVGRDLSAMYVREPHAPGHVVLSLDRVTNADVHGVSFEVRAGEIVGLAGLVGAGRTELARAIFGDVPIDSGRILWGGDDPPPGGDAPPGGARPLRELHLQSPRDAIRAGIGLAPEERKTEALLMKRSVRDNTSLAVLDQLRRFRFIRGDLERDLVREYASKLRVRTPSLEREVRTLSGGNQQKVVLARWLARRPKLLILDEPTRGVDVGVKAEIYAIIAELAREGIAVLVISSDLPEVIGLSDRIVVMHCGRVTGEVHRSEATEERIMALAMADYLKVPAASVSARAQQEGAS